MSAIFNSTPHNSLNPNTNRNYDASILRLLFACFADMYRVGNGCSRTSNAVGKLLQRLTAATEPSMQTQAKRTKVITLDTLNPHIKLMEYAVRGPIVTRAAEIEKELSKVRTDYLAKNEEISAII